MPTETRDQHKSSSPRPTPGNGQRRYTRAALTLPVRLRWQGPFGLETEITESCDASRGGLLVSSRQIHHVGSLVWVTSPYDRASPLAQLETQARVAHCEQSKDGDQFVGIEFESRKLPGRGPQATAKGALRSLSETPSRQYFELGDRRRRARVAVALFVRISRSARPRTFAITSHDDAPWPEETMTRNVSPGGMLFYSLRIHEAGDLLTVTLPKGGILPVGDLLARVIHLAPLDATSPLLQVGVQFLYPESAGR